MTIRQYIQSFKIIMEAFQLPRRKAPCPSVMYGNIEECLLVIMPSFKIPLLCRNGIYVLDVWPKYQKSLSNSFLGGPNTGRSVLYQSRHEISSIRHNSAT